jgi:hypothetical protein
MGQKRTLLTLLDHLIGAQRRRHRQFDAERFGGFAIENETGLAFRAINQNA